jgi:hypothetical protein
VLADTVINGITWGNAFTVSGGPNWVFGGWLSFCPRGSVLVQQFSGSQYGYVSDVCQPISAPGLTWGSKVELSIYDFYWGRSCPYGSFMLAGDSSWPFGYCQPIQAPGLTWGPLVRIGPSPYFSQSRCPAGSFLNIYIRTNAVDQYCQSLSVATPPPPPPPPPTTRKPPTISGSATCTTGVAQSYTVTSVDSDPTALIHYGFDWTGGTTVSQWVPLSATDAEGTSETVSHTWTTNGAHRFAVEAVDSSGNASGWATLNVVCTPKAICPDICPNGYQVQSGQCVFVGCPGGVCS